MNALEATRRGPGERGAALRLAAAAEFVGLAPKTVSNLLTLKKFPKPHKQGSRNVWFVDELEAYNKAHVSDYDAVHSTKASS